MVNPHDLLYVVLVEYRSLCTLDCSPKLGVGTHEAEVENQPESSLSAWADYHL